MFRNWFASVWATCPNDATREYLEIAVLSLVLHEAAKATRLVELVHRAIPYPVLLISARTDTVALSVAHKRRAQNEADKVVLDDTVIEAALVPDVSSSALAMLSAGAQARAHAEHRHLAALPEESVDWDTTRRVVKTRQAVLNGEEFNRPESNWPQPKWNFLATRCV
ncbi:MAG TPA: DUF4391 domain-containing protein [Pirellulales bacterium]|nr:DUF4391 domain-containing protein [Pirellulales bacterium]